MTRVLRPFILLAFAIVAVGGDPYRAPIVPEPLEAAVTPSCDDVTRYIDSSYGAKIARIVKPDGHLHNIYYHRNPWNADVKRLIGIQTNLEQRNWRVVLYDENGCLTNDLFGIEEYDWRVVWDRKDPASFYTTKRSDLYRYDVNTRRAARLKSFAPSGLRFKPSGPSLNQAGDRILVVTSDGMVRSYRVSDMGEERIFDAVAGLPPGCTTDWDDIRYIGYLDYVAVNCVARERHLQAVVIYDPAGVPIHTFYGFSGHYDFSPSGKIVYFQMPGGARGERRPLQIKISNIDGTDTKIVHSVPHEQARYLQNLHVSWADKVNDWFVASFFPSARNLPETYAPLLDEIVLVSTSGKHKFLARTETKIEGRQGFWAQPLASPSADGSRISFNSNRSGTIGHHILSVPTPPFP